MERAFGIGAVTTDMPRILGHAVVAGAAASVTSSLALAVGARAEGRGALQPVNATSHWLHGQGAAGVSRGDIAHTGVGYATHHAATTMWALLFEALVARRASPTPIGLARDAAGVAVLAAAVDYVATPKRFTPGWELVLSRRSMAFAYAAMAAGMAATAYARDRGDQ